MPVQYNGTQRGRAATKNQYQNNHRGHEGNQCNSGRENLRSTRRISWIVVQRRTKAKTSYGGETKDTKEKQRKKINNNKKENTHNIINKKKKKKDIGLRLVLFFFFFFFFKRLILEITQ